MRGFIPLHCPSGPGFFIDKHRLIILYDPLLILKYPVLYEPKIRGRFKYYNNREEVAFFIVFRN